MKQLGVLLFPLGGMLGMLAFCQFTLTDHWYPFILLGGEGTVGVTCLAREHNTMTQARARTQTARSRVQRANHQATAPPTNIHL